MGSAPITQLKRNCMVHNYSNFKQSSFKNELGHFQKNARFFLLILIEAGCTNVTQAQVSI